MSNDTSLAEAINLAEIAAHPTEAIAALVQVVQQQEEKIAHLQENQEILFGIIAKLKGQINPKPSEAQVDQATVL